MAVQATEDGITVHGIGVSPGVVIGPAFVLARQLVKVSEWEVAEDQVGNEICRLENALIETRRQIKGIQKNLESRAGMRDASILDAHLMVLDDRSFIEEIVTEIRDHRRNVEVVVRNASERYAEVLSAVKDDYLRERVADVRVVARRIIMNLCGQSESSLEDVQHRHIVVAVDLAPSETASMRKDMVEGFATDLGSPTSHTAVMARALEIPAIVGMRDISRRVSNGDEILIDGNKGVLIIRPTQEQLEQYGRVAEARRDIEASLDSLRLEPAETLDGHRIVLSANVEGPEELESVVEHGAEGIGLFRSEYLYLARERVMTEAEQAEVFKEVASRLAPHPVIIRTLDIGGDKFLPDKERHQEANPFLGCRSIRMSLLHPDEFRMQLRAILKASSEQNVKIMYPMISSVGEVIRANEILEEAKAELAKDNIPFDRDIDVGVMIEIPAAALTADVIAEHVDFFSIGTNDLVQYTIAVDRVNERVAYLYEPTHPAVLRLIQHAVQAAHRHDIWVGVCGEMGADPLMTPLLLGLGVDELSVAPAAVPMVKDAVRTLKMSQAKALSKTALRCQTGAEVLGHCRKLIRKVAPELLELI